MATKQQLKKRWETPEGQNKAQAVLTTLKDGTTVEQLHTIVDILPYTDEVSPALDLRGMTFRNDVSLFDTNLSGVRLNYATIQGRISRGSWIGAVLDEINGTDLVLKVDLTQASLVNAKLTRATLMNAVLVGANLSGARLVGADLEGVRCTNANFSGADLRGAVCAHVDFRGANLSLANLTGAVLGSILFDDNTNIQGATLDEDNLSPDFRQFVKQAQAVKASPYGESADEVAEIDATIAVLQRENTNDHLDKLIDILGTVRQELQKNPKYRWALQLDHLPEDLKEAFDKAYEQGIADAEEYL